MAINTSLVPSTTPYDAMVYSDTTHRYVLTTDHINDEFNEQLDVLAGSQDNADALLREISRQVYRWMYSQIPNNTRVQLEYLIAKDTDYAQIIEEAMLEQYRYARVSGGNLVAHQSGINPESGIAISSQAIANLKVSTEVKQVLETGNCLNQVVRLHINEDLIRSDY